MIANLILNPLKWIRNNYNIVATLLISVLVSIVLMMNSSIQIKNQQIDKLNNNVLFYQEQTSSIKDENRTLQLTIDEFKQSKDSVIVQLDELRKELKIKDDELEQVQQISQEIKVDTTVIVKEDNFVQEIKPNELTSLLISKKDSILTAKLDIKNEQTLFISTKKEYKNEYKNWFCRLIHFDFKKRTVRKYNIYNSNDLIKVLDTRVVQLSD